MNRQIQFNEEPNRGGKNNFNMEMALANEVYVFYDKDKPGIKFYDRTPEEGSIEGRLLGVPPKGVYYTDNVEEAHWNDEINKPGETILVRYVDGSNSVTTVMVTEQEMIRILEEIEEEKKKSPDGRIRIDLRQKEKTNIDKLTFNSIKDKSLNEEIKKIDNKDMLNELNKINEDYIKKPEDEDF